MSKCASARVALPAGPRGKVLVRRRRVGAGLHFKADNMIGQHGHGVRYAERNIDAKRIPPQDEICPASSKVKNASWPSSTKTIPTSADPPQPRIPILKKGVSRNTRFDDTISAVQGLQTGYLRTLPCDHHHGEYC
jgi:hypothetical protein